MYLGLVGLCLTAMLGQADADADKQKLEDEIRKELGAPAEQPGTTAPAAPSTPETPPAPAPATTGGSPFARILMLPDLSVIGDFGVAYDTYDVHRQSPRGADDPISIPHRVTPLLQEVELALQAVVDPYARADFFLALHSDGIEIEEAYLTALALPAGLSLRAGQLKSPFGRQNQQHLHTLDFADVPLAQARLLSADALAGPGLALSWLTPLPWYAELQTSFQRTTPAFEPDARLTAVARLLQYFDLTAASALGFGLSAARLDEPGGGAWRDLAGADLYLKIRPPSGRAYVALQAEGFARRSMAPNTAQNVRYGAYGQIVWRPSPYFSYGARYDHAPPALETDTGVERRVTGVFTWYPSEFQKLRLQVAGVRTVTAARGLETLLQYEFVIGAHGAHPF